MRVLVAVLALSGCVTQPAPDPNDPKAVYKAEYDACANGVRWKHHPHREAICTCIAREAAGGAACKF